MANGQYTEPVPAMRMAADCVFRTSELRNILGMRIWDIDLACAAQYLVARAIAGNSQQAFFVNAHCVNVAARHEEYARLLQAAPFVFADGFGMALAARMSGVTLANNVNGTDLFPFLCKAAAAAAVPMAFLGAKPGVAAACAERMRQKIPGLRIVWAEHGYHTQAVEKQKLEELNASGARILLVAKGVPQQELWMAGHAAELSVPVMIGVGALFDFYSGIIPRAPQRVRDMRMEWAFRLLREPRRLFRRYVIGNPEFLVRTLIRRLLD